MLAPPPGRVAHTQRFPLAVPARVWDLLVPRLGALGWERFAAPPLPLAVVSVSSAPEGNVHQALAAGGQLRVRAPAGRSGTGFRVEAEEVEEEGDRHLGISGSVRHLEETHGRHMKR